LTDDDGHVALARNLDEHRTTLETVPQQPPRRRRDPCDRALRGELGRRQRPYPWCPGPDRRAVRDDLLDPTGRHERLRGGGATGRPDQQRTVLELRAQGEHLARVRRGAALLAVV